MRCWKLPEGFFLAEGPPYWLLGPDLTVRGVFDDRPWSEDDRMGVVAHAVEGDELRCTCTDLETGHADTSVRLRGLALLPPGAGPTEDQVRAAIERHRTEANDRFELDRRQDAARLESFRRALPDLGSERDLRFVWRYEPPLAPGGPPTVAISRKGGPVLWRDGTWPWQGKGLYRDLKRVLEERYGDRLAALDLDLNEQEWAAFDAD